MIDSGIIGKGSKNTFRLTRAGDWYSVLIDRQVTGKLCPNIIIHVLSGCILDIFQLLFGFSAMQS
jgi:hypothetical protein